MINPRLHKWYAGYFHLSEVFVPRKLTSIDYINLAPSSSGFLVDPEIHQIFPMKDFSRLSEHGRTGGCVFLFHSIPIWS